MTKQQVRKLEQEYRNAFEKAKVLHLRGEVESSAYQAALGAEDLAFQRYDLALVQYRQCQRRNQRRFSSA